jgi:preprotein translocase subunit SecE
MNNYIQIALWAAVVGIVFAILWRKGYLRRLANYVRDTKEELRKCTWPTWSELRGSTIVILVATLMLGLFTVALDFVSGSLVRFLIS